MVNAFDIKEAYNRIQDYIVKTPLTYAPELSLVSGANVYLKMENLQLTGSFKIRGMLNKLFRLDKHDFTKPFIASSSGNHAAAFGYASERFGFSGVLFLPENVNKEKAKALEAYRMEKILYGKNNKETEAEATRYAQEINGVLVHPYNDVEIVKGQGTVGLEIADQLPEVDSILVPIGGGGLASGIASYFKDSEKVEVIGCQPENAAEMYQSIQENRIVPTSTLETIADASAGGIEEDAITFAICKEYLSGFELLKEPDIKNAVRHIYQHHGTVVEPTSALSVAALLNSKEYKGKNVVLVLTGKKISESLLKELSKEYAYNT